MKDWNRMKTQAWRRFSEAFEEKNTQPENAQSTEFSMNTTEVQKRHREHLDPEGGF